MTNADLIRSMTDEELAEYLDFINDEDCLTAMGRISCREAKNGCPCWLEWLRSETNG